MAISPSMLDLNLELSATNPNGFDLNVEGVTATVTMNANQKIGTATSTTPISMPKKSSTKITVPLKFQTAALGPIIAAGLQNKSVPYQVQGEADIGSSKLRLKVPFTIQGTLSATDLRRTAVQSVPDALKPLLDGLPKLPLDVH